MSRPSKKSLANLKPAKKGEVRNPHGSKGKASLSYRVSQHLKEKLQADHLIETWRIWDHKNERWMVKKNEIKIDGQSCFAASIANRLIMEGGKGDISAIREIIDRIEGKAVQKMEMKQDVDVREIDWDKLSDRQLEVADKALATLEELKKKSES